MVHSPGRGSQYLWTAWGDTPTTAAIAPRVAPCARTWPHAARSSGLCASTAATSLRWFSATCRRCSHGSGCPARCCPTARPALRDRVRLGRRRPFLFFLRLATIPVSSSTPRPLLSRAVAQKGLIRLGNIAVDRVPARTPTRTPARTPGPDQESYPGIRPRSPPALTGRDCPPSQHDPPPQNPEQQAPSRPVRGQPTNHNDRYLRTVGPLPPPGTHQPLRHRPLTRRSQPPQADDSRRKGPAGEVSRSASSCGLVGCVRGVDASVVPIR